MVANDSIGTVIYFALARSICRSEPCLCCCFSSIVPFCSAMFCPHSRTTLTKCHFRFVYDFVHQEIEDDRVSVVDALQVIAPFFNQNNRPNQSHLDEYGRLLALFQTPRSPTKPFNCRLYSLPLIVFVLIPGD